MTTPAPAPITTIKIVEENAPPIVLDQAGIYEIRLEKPGAHAEITGNFLTTGDDKVEIELYITHAAPRTTAQTTLKGVAKDKSYIRFFGRITIEPNCGQTQSFLEERVLLLSSQARADAVPELEILSDDVKCSHAASISRIPEEQLFYLMSRGISRAAAEQLIVEGFLRR